MIRRLLAAGCDNDAEKWGRHGLYIVPVCDLRGTAALIKHRCAF